MKRCAVNSFVLLTLAVLSLVFTGCQSPRAAGRSAAELLAARSNYPAQWWAPVPTNGAPTWEILPQ